MQLIMKKIITFNDQLEEADYILENVDKTLLWKTYQNIFNHLKYEDGDIFIFTNEIKFMDGEEIKYDLGDKHFKWINKNKLLFICTRKFIETLNINKISKLRWEGRNANRSSGVEIILENHRQLLNGK